MKKRKFLKLLGVGITSCFGINSIEARSQSKKIAKKAIKKNKLKYKFDISRSFSAKSCKLGDLIGTHMLSKDLKSKKNLEEYVKNDPSVPIEQREDYKELRSRTLAIEEIVQYANLNKEYFLNKKSIV